MTTDTSKDPIKSRIDFVLVFSVDNANPNGDPGYDNRPRMDAYTRYGFVTDVCLKRKIRNRVEMIKNLPMAMTYGFVQGHICEKPSEIRLI